MSCFGSQDGWIKVNVTGGTPPYTFLWSNDATTDSIGNLSASYFSVTVTDSDSTHATDGITLTTPLALKAELSSPVYANKFNVSCYNCFNGSISSVVGGGVSPYNYLWLPDSNAVQNQSGLQGGEYRLLVFDANGCKMIEKILLTEPNGGWSIAGNYGTDPSSHFIGTNDSSGLVLRTSATEQLRISGIGEISVAGNLKFNAYAGDSMPKPLFVGIDGMVYRAGQQGSIRTACNTLAAWYVGQNVVRDVVLCDPEQRVGIEGCADPLEALQIGDRWAFHSSHGTQDNKAISYNSRWNGAANVKFVQGYSSSINFNDEGSLDLKVDNEIGSQGSVVTWFNALHVDKTGRITLGAYTTASEQLEIVHDKEDGGLALNRVNATNEGKSEIKFQHNGLKHFALGVDLNNDSHHNFFIWAHDANAGLGASRFFINENGQVGIGYNPPGNANSDYKLFVEGGIAARDVRVKAFGWPDYVLKKEFALMSIDELGNFIAENEHLPGFPSAKEIEENEGYEAGDMIQRQQRQIEQQALYIISIKKEMDAMKKEIDELKKRLKNNSTLR